MKCDDNESFPKLKVQRKNTKREQSKHGPLQKLEVELGAMEERASSAYRSHPPCVLRRNREDV